MGPGPNGTINGIKKKNTAGEAGQGQGLDGRYEEVLDCQYYSYTIYAIIRPSTPEWSLPSTDIPERTAAYRGSGNWRTAADFLDAQSADRCLFRHSTSG